MKELPGQGPSIVFLCTTLDWGGVEGNAVELARAYARHGLRPAVIADGGPLHRLPALQDAGIPTVVLGVTADWSDERYAAALRDALHRLEARVLHVQAWERLPQIFGLANRLEIPTVFTLHTTVTHNLRDRLGLYRNPARFWSQERAIRREKPVVVNISDLSEASFRRRYPTVTRTRRVYCGAYLPLAPVDASVGGDAPQVLWVGSLIRRKRPLWALALWRRVVQAFPKAHLTLVGGGPLLPQVEKQAADFPPGTVTVAGNVSDMRPLLEQTQIMLHTAKQEGIPKNILYAATFGIPTVASNVGAISEAVLHGRTGYLAAMHDGGGLVRALRALAGDPDLRGRLGDAARRHGEAAFGLEKHIAENLRVYADFCGLALDGDGLTRREEPVTLT